MNRDFLITCILTLIITTIFFGGLMATRYPVCAPGHVAVIAPNAYTGFACVLGYYPDIGGR